MQSELLPENTSGLIGFNIEGVKTSFGVISSTKMWRGDDYVRSPDEVSKVPDYGEGSNLVTVKLFHSGGFVTNRKGELTYLKVEVDYFDEVTTDQLCLE
ncbi:OLC1v1018593C1 [Oldenlandia corymbosa var. corymbosa]|uniref:OLC1v1018593C1 n=1 Tax=Oldenlandia corymbosa var. corymbosa TaxID=529605 RepID=A0AAV1EC30_OLDCO|nr:OLC1v1018593C1 [Oldenlandia corymbosa var. corymbosa]